MIVHFYLIGAFVMTLHVQAQTSMTNRDKVLEYMRMKIHLYVRQVLRKSERDALLLSGKCVDLARQKNLMIRDITKLSTAEVEAISPDIEVAKALHGAFNQT